MSSEEVRQAEEKGKRGNELVRVVSVENTESSRRVEVGRRSSRMCVFLRDETWTGCARYRLG